MKTRLHLLGSDAFNILSVLLSLSMVVTGVTVGGKAKEAEAATAESYTITIDNAESLAGTIQSGTVNITGSVVKGDDNVWGKITIASNVEGFEGATVFVEDGIFDATVDISQVRDMYVPITATLIDDASILETQQADPKASATAKIAVTSNKGYLVKYNLQTGDYYPDLSMGKIVDKHDGMDVVFEEANFFYSGETSIGNCYVEISDAEDSEAKITQNEARELITDVVATVNGEDVREDGIVNEDVLTDNWKSQTDLVYIEGLDTESGEDGDTEKLLTKVRITVNNPWYSSNVAVFKDCEATAAELGIATGSSFGLSFKIKGDDSAGTIDNAATPSANLEDVTDTAYPDTFPERAEEPSQAPEESTAPDGGNGDTAEAATVTAVAMAPQAMTATAGSVTTMAAVSAVSTSGITAAEQLETDNLQDFARLVAFVQEKDYFP